MPIAVTSSILEEQPKEGKKRGDKVFFIKISDH